MHALPIEQLSIGSIEKAIARKKAVYPDHEIIFRGQSKPWPLLPGIARNNDKGDTTFKEKEMLSALKHSAPIHISKVGPLPANDWEWIIFAQHFGMKTRLLDWSADLWSSLWFACIDDPGSDGVLYGHFIKESSYLDVGSLGPFDIEGTRFLIPRVTNRRIENLSSRFSVHPYNFKECQHIPIEGNHDLHTKTIKILVPASKKQALLGELDGKGINYIKVMADASGVCKHINWKHLPQ